jgi:Domain of unknown function (DUF4386)
MTRTTNARIAGVALLAYIAVGITDMVINGRAKAGADAAAKLASMAQHSSDIRVTVLFGMVEVFCALVLAVTLWAITREVDADIAMMGLVCRVAEGVLGALAIPHTLSLLWLANTPDLDPAASRALGSYLFNGGGGVAFTATFFAVGSLLFAWLLLRGRMIPVALAWLGVVASVLLVVWLPLQLVSVLPNTPWIWLPMFFFEVPLALWFLIKGIAPPSPRSGRQIVAQPALSGAEG